MKTIMIILSIVTLSVGSIAGPTVTKVETSATSNVVVQEPDIQILAKGIVCAFCAQGLKKAFQGHPSIERLHFDAEFNAMDLYLKPKASLSDTEIRETVKNAGFLVDKITRK